MPLKYFWVNVTGILTSASNLIVILFFVPVVKSGMITFDPQSPLRMCISIILTCAAAASLAALSYGTRTALVRLEQEVAKETGSGNLNQATLADVVSQYQTA